MLENSKFNISKIHGNAQEGRIPEFSAWKSELAPAEVGLLFHTACLELGKEDL